MLSCFNNRELILSLGELEQELGSCDQPSSTSCFSNQLRNAKLDQEYLRISTIVKNMLSGLEEKKEKREQDYNEVREFEPVMKPIYIFPKPEKPGKFTHITKKRYMTHLREKVEKIKERLETFKMLQGLFDEAMQSSTQVLENLIGLGDSEVDREKIAVFKNEHYKPYIKLDCRVRQRVQEMIQETGRQLQPSTHSLSSLAQTNYRQEKDSQYKAAAFFQQILNLKKKCDDILSSCLRGIEANAPHRLDQSMDSSGEDSFVESSGSSDTDDNVFCSLIDPPDDPFVTPEEGYQERE